jgi:hypothetical protein
VLKDMERLIHEFHDNEKCVSTSLCPVLVTSCTCLAQFSHSALMPLGAKCRCGVRRCGSAKAAGGPPLRRYAMLRISLAPCSPFTVNEELMVRPCRPRCPAGTPCSEWASPPVPHSTSPMT